MSKMLREPLVHFLVAGLGLFLLFEIVAKDDAYEQKVIRVNQDALLTFVQYRSQSFDPNIGAARLNNMSDADFERLVADYIREEALHREALAMGMEKNDYIIKRRLIQSIEFITAGFVTAGIELEDEDIKTYYEANRENYFVEPYLTFTHVYFSSESHGREGARAMADAMLDELNAGPVPFSEASRYGDRFLYTLNYVERERGFITSHFGPQMAEAIFELAADETNWRGPFESAYGFHLVLLPQKAEGRYPELEEIEETVRYDAERDAVTALKDKAIQAIVDTYEVRHEVTRPLADPVQ